MISTAKIEQSAYIAIDHPDDWTPEQVQAALTAKIPEELAFAAPEVGDVVMDTSEPDDPEAAPISLTVDDLPPEGE